MLVKVEAYHDGKFWCERGIRADFFTQGRTLDELLKNLKEAAALHFDEALTTKTSLRVSFKLATRLQKPPQE